MASQPSMVNCPVLSEPLEVNTVVTLKEWLKFHGEDFPVRAKKDDLIRFLPGLLPNLIPTDKEGTFVISPSLKCWLHTLV